jgi:hypothetical protein
VDVRGPPKTIQVFGLGLRVLQDILVERHSFGAMIASTASR